jgi:hypothetical protein
MTNAEMAVQFDVRTTMIAPRKLLLLESAARIFENNSNSKMTSFTAT